MKRCYLCPKSTDLRPYGPKGEWVCFACAMKDKPTTERMYGMQLDAAGPIAIISDDTGPRPYEKGGEH